MAGRAEGSGRALRMKSSQRSRPVTMSTAIVPEPACTESVFRSNVLANTSHAADTLPQAAREGQPAFLNMHLISVSELICHELRGWLKTSVSDNISSVFVTESACHESRGWLKAAAQSNIDVLPLTESTCHESMFWSKAGASRNMPLDFVTKPTCHELRRWSKTSVSRNISSAFVTESACHELRGWLNFLASFNMDANLCKPLVQFETLHTLKVWKRTARAAAVAEDLCGRLCLCCRMRYFRGTVHSRLDTHCTLVE